VYDAPLLAPHAKDRRTLPLTRLPARRIRRDDHARRDMTWFAWRRAVGWRAVDRPTIGYTPNPPDESRPASLRMTTEEQGREGHHEPKQPPTPTTHHPPTQESNKAADEVRAALREARRADRCGFVGAHRSSTKDLRTGRPARRWRSAAAAYLRVELSTGIRNAPRGCTGEAAFARATRQAARDAPALEVARDPRGQVAFGTKRPTSGFRADSRLMRAAASVDFRVTTS